MGGIKNKFKIIFKIFFSIFLGVTLLFLTKIKFSPILGTEMNFSLAVLIGPTFAKIFGVFLGSFAIVLTQIIGIFLGILQFEGLKDIFAFLPMIFAGIFFAKNFRQEKRIIFFPLFCIFLFLLHPIGRDVWFYSLFWLVPIFLTIFRIPQFDLFSNSLATAFVDHAVGSVIYLYFLNITAKFWIQAIPLTITERIFIGIGISIFYFVEKTILRFLLKIPLFAEFKRLIFA